MKAIRIIFFILIIIGLAALATYKLWVPKLVNYIISSEDGSKTAQDTQPNVLLKDGRQCYTYSQEATAEAPYTVSEFLDITINGKMVTGTKTGTQAGPDMTNGYSGTFSGVLNNDKITAVFAYVVEGSHNQEQEIYRANKTGLEKLRYPLVDRGGILMPDLTQSFKTLNYARVGCTASN